MFRGRVPYPALPQRRDRQRILPCPPLACQESVGKISQDGLLLVNVLRLAPIPLSPHRSPSSTQLSPCPGPRAYALESSLAIPGSRGRSPGRKAIYKGPLPRRACSLLSHFVGTTHFRLYGFLTPCPPGPQTPPPPGAGDSFRTGLGLSRAVGYITGLVHETGLKPACLPPVFPPPPLGYWGLRLPDSLCPVEKPNSHRRQSKGASL